MVGSYFLPSRLQSWRLIIKKCVKQMLLYKADEGNLHMYSGYKANGGDEVV